MTLAAPSLETLIWEAGGPQEVKAWVCRVNAKHQGVVEHDKVIAVRQEKGWNQVGDGFDPVPNLTVWGVQDTILAQYPLEEVWGAWMQWPYKTFRSSAGDTAMGPRHFLEFGFKQYEWMENGSIRKRHDPSPKTHSIWCDGSDTDGAIMTASRTRWDDYNSDINGWLRAERVSWQKRRENRKFPNIP